MGGRSLKQVFIMLIWRDLRRNTIFQCLRQ